MGRRSTTRDPFEEAVRATASRYQMLEGERRVVVAVSGGPDSMALLYALVRLRSHGGPSDDRWPEPIVSHLDHRLRGEESDEDARFVAEAASRLGLEAIVERSDVAAIAAASARNLEAVAREVRYAFLERAAASAGASRVATGHTASDQAETVLMRLARGAGPDGLSGIAATRPLSPGVLLVRPLLGVTREQTLGYCREREIAYRTDATNADTNRARASVRAEVLPLLERISPGASASLARAAGLAAFDRAFFDSMVSEIMDGWGVAASGAVDLPVEEVAVLPTALRFRVLREAVRRARGDLKRLDSEHVERLDRLLSPGRGGREAVLPYGLVARRIGKRLIVGVARGETG